MNPTEQAMRGVVEETFAALAFMFPLDAEGSAAVDPGTMERAVVEFSGPFRGALLISASAEMLEPLAANMLGLEDGVCSSREQRRDAFKELLNVICGNLLPVIASPRQVFDVNEPRLLAGEDDYRSAVRLGELGTIDMDLDTGHIRLTLLAEHQPTAAETAPGGKQA